MKLIYCDKCEKLIELSYEKKECPCGRIGGKYHENGASASIYFNQFHGCRILAIDTNLILGKVEQSMDYVFDWENSGLTVYYKGVKIKNTPDNYLEKNAKIFLKNGVNLLKKSENKRLIKLSYQISKAIKAIKI